MSDKILIDQNQLAHLRKNPYKVAKNKNGDYVTNYPSYLIVNEAVLAISFWPTALNRSRFKPII